MNVLNLAYGFVERYNFQFRDIHFSEVVGGFEPIGVLGQQGRPGFFGMHTLLLLEFDHLVVAHSSVVRDGRLLIRT